MTISGELFIGGERVAAKDFLYAENPASNEKLEPAFSCAGREEIARACALANDCFDSYRETGLEERAAFLERIANEIEKIGEALTARAMLETGLPAARLEGERGRTVGQLKLFAQVVRKGDWLGARVDSAAPERKPAPRPRLLQRKIPLGPVAVFGASNFPLAFSVAGGDTASALAAGCPVIVKGHPAHPGAGELVAGAVSRAVQACGMPPGVFSLLNGGTEAGAALVADPRIKAVGFTGSRGGGLALAQIAASRPEPIPVYAEMSSVNPVLLFQNALERRGDAMGAAFIASLTMGAGQFCTNPGLVLGVNSQGLDRFIAAAASAVKNSAGQTMLTGEICQAYRAGVERMSAHPEVKSLAVATAGGVNQGAPALFEVKATDILADPSLQDELFGAAALVVRCKNEIELAELLEALEGQLTATMQIEDGDETSAADLLPILERKAGRVIVNGWPTGVEVSHAMVHGGPFPAASDSRTTSVGSYAIERFLRPVCYQNIPDGLLPNALQETSLVGLRRLIDGEWKG